jgi:hypothetical protein
MNNLKITILMLFCLQTPVLYFLHPHSSSHFMGKPSISLGFIGFMPDLIMFLWQRPSFSTPTFESRFCEVKQTNSSFMGELHRFVSQNLFISL